MLVMIIANKNISDEIALSHKAVKTLSELAPDGTTRQRWQAPYLFTTENLVSSFDCLPDLAGKNVLTLAGSGDHAFEALYRGAKKSYNS